jgi:O-methyltransferase
MGLVTNVLKKIYRTKKLNLEVRPFRNERLAENSEIIRPYSNYAPWKIDKDFIKVFEKIKGHTLVDIYRNYELWDLVSQIPNQIEGDLLEVGVWRGGTAGVMASKLNAVAPGKKIFLADTFTGVVKATDADSQYNGGEHADTSEQTVKDLLSRDLGLNNFELLKGIFPEDTGSRISDRKFCLCHVDVDVYLSTKDIVEWIWPRLAVGGMIIYDDFGYIDTDGIIKFVNEEKMKPDRVITYNLNGHAVEIKLR